VKIIVADDDPTSRLLAAAAVRSAGHECESVVDGEQAWQAFNVGAPDVMISDWLMPGISGVDLCRRVRASGADRYTYFVLVTSQRDRGQVLEGMRAGADDYLIKPLRPEILRERLIAAERVTSLHHLLGAQRAQLEALNSELTGLARRDPLTRLGNRRALQEDLEQLQSRVERYGHRYCLALLDIDHFKAYNDTYGHAAGDRVLRGVGDELMKQVRGGDSVYRYGGEEFLCIFPEQSLSTGQSAVERMRRAIEGLRVEHSGNPVGVVTVSAGLSILDAGLAKSAADVLDEADRAMYRAKHLGRNRVEVASPLFEPQ
jgi:diguanylate cyclase (GGDEF)-like protein